MKANKIVIAIKKPVKEVFFFTITPPNSTYWIPAIVNEKTNELPIKKGTVYTLETKNGHAFEVTVTNFKPNITITFISRDKNYNCRYTYRPLDKKTCELEYHEWVDRGELNEPFTPETLQKLKSVIETL